ncbi:glycine betaine/L-proline ABC transporter ATP-binding protein ProV [Oceanidesulfovibrio marinus]|uniref:Proline/glycine betaine ABC transporter ATP-binding protein ProV n=1 Tax=Oceanidesulfovibrio marinus TaxID=370038 RepID=A0A6P1ZE39_9BACT|nr:glycine betaine/L-proline ABC transporter ATP-binding protein ProV [Oceanidesulfovibrio marinus]TVM31390.1 proline/glycine betaine ABC transporter ATP-binding protein ProV [Oceanidesulfovibrio marinus]
MNEKIVVKNLYKIFGKEPKKAIELVQQGHDKQTIHKETGMTVGVQDASFSVMEGEVFVVMGLSGSGKSTLVRMLNRLIEPSSGNVYVDGEDVAQMSQDALVNLRRRNMTMVFQSFALMPHMTVLENVAFGLEMAGISKKDREHRAAEALEQVGLGPYARSRPRQLSGGMQQRVGLARGLAVDPDIMLMDEAFSALDPLIRTEMQDELLKLQQEHTRTIVFISHDLDEAMRIGDRIAIMEGGRIVQVGTPEEILRNPADEYVRSFFRGVDPTNILTARDIVRDTQTTVITRDGLGPRTALERLTSQDRDFAFVLDPAKRYQGTISVESLRQAVEREQSGAAGLKSAMLDNVIPARPEATMQDILAEVAANPWPVPVVDEAGAYLGAISKNIFLRTLQREAEQARTEG